ncbi:MAG TPA: hypothetical protein ENN17_06720 [bacterium]|mgnify:CR=1 FL=1|nr:hypothetical protein [bacterium]
MKVKLLTRFGWIAAAILLLAGCEYSGPEAIWNPDADLGEIPLITRIDPPDSAGIGVGEIRIIGEGLGLSRDQTEIYFNHYRAQIKTFSPTEIVVWRPAVTGDDITIKVLVDGAYVMAKSPHYQIPAVYRDYGDILQKGVVVLLDVAADDNVYVMIRRDIYKVTPDETNYQVGTQGFSGSTSDIKIGPGGYLYMKKVNHALVYRLDLSIEDPAAEPEEFGTMARQASYIDFDAHGNLYGGGRQTGISVLKDGESRRVSNFQDLDIRGLRVFDGYVYVFDNQSNIWRARILDADGNLDDKEPELSWEDTGEYATSTLSSFDFAADGTIYCGTDHANPIFMLYRDGTIEPLYPGILTPVAGKVVWSNHGDIFVNQTGRAGIPDLYLLRVNKEGAPYYGRIL